MQLHLAHNPDRPWPAPRAPWMLEMHWHDLLFMHWPVPAEALRGLIPRSLALETYGGTAWLGVVPFRMRHVHPRGIPPVPWLSAFPELNVRTYVSAGGKPGVWFFSLDAANPVAVRLARAGFHLPYFDARMALQCHNDLIEYTSQRTHRRAPPARLHMRYRPTGPIYRSAPGSLEHWLTERYCLYAADRRGRVWRCNIDHVPWPLQPAEAEIDINAMTYQIGLRPPDTPPLLHFAQRLVVAAWLLERAA